MAMVTAFPRVRLLPEELVSAILAPYLSVPLNRFNDTSSLKSPFNAPDHLSTSVILVVCKQWLRVATPLLYNTVIIRSKRQAASLEETIKSNPSLGTFIRRLRLEGPYGTTLEHIVRVSPGISDLCLFFTVLPEDEGFDVASLYTLVKVLPSINPTTFNINVAPPAQRLTHTGRCPGGPMNLIHVLESGITENLSKWTNLVTVQLKLNWVSCAIHGAGCSDDLNTRHRDFAIALGGTHSIRTVHLGFKYDPRLSVSEIITMISKNPSIRKIELQSGFSFQTCLAHCIGFDTLQLGRIIYIDGRSLQEIRIKTILTPMACAIASKFDNFIWRRIIEHAISQAMLPARTICSLIKVCKRFRELGIPYLYRHPIFSSIKSFTRFISQIRDTPHLRPHVVSLTFLMTRDPCFRMESQETEDIMAKTFRLLPNIKMLKSWNMASGLHLSWEAFEAICETSAENITIFQPGAIAKPTNERLVRTAVLQAFRNITSLRWNSLVGFDMNDEGHFPSNILPSLVELEYKHTFVQTTGLSGNVPSLLAALCHLELPTIRTLLLSGDSCPEAARFLEYHGAKIQMLELNTRTENPGALLQCCPSLVALRIVGNVVPWSDEYRNMFKSCSFDAHPLRSVAVTLREARAWSQKTPVGAEELRPWAKILDPVVYRGFPSLDEIRVSECQWPETEREMKTNHWPKISSKLMTVNIKLYGRDGRCWVPRMGDTTSRVHKK